MDRSPDDEDEFTSTTTRILIVDDHAVVRQGLRTFLDLEPRYRDALAAAGRQRSDQRSATPTLASR